MAADIATAADTLARAVGDAPRAVPQLWVDDLARRIADAGGVPGAAARVERSERSARSDVRIAPVDSAAVSAAVRSFADQVARDLTDVWGAAVRSAAVGRLSLLTERLDAELGAVRPVVGPATGGGVRFGSVAVGLASLVGSGLVAASGRIALAVALGVLAVLLVAVGWLAARAAARRSTAEDGRAVVEECERVIGRVVRAQVVAPVQAELASYQRFRAGLDAVVGVPRRTS